MSTITYSQIALPPGKKGVLRPDSDGYYRTVAGALNVYSSAGDLYVLDKAKRLFDASSVLMRRVNEGCLKSEVGHPRCEAGWGRDEYFMRIMDIYEPNVCGHIRKIELDHDNGDLFPRSNGLVPVPIWIEIKPAGPHAAALESSFLNPHENTCFSIRSFTEDVYIRGVRHRTLDTVVTFDWVNESGIPIARKWKTPGLESFDIIVLKECTFDDSVVETPLLANQFGLSLESELSVIKELKENIRIRNDKSRLMSW